MNFDNQLDDMEVNISIFALNYYYDLTERERERFKEILLIFFKFILKLKYIN